MNAHFWHKKRAPAPRVNLKPHLPKVISSIGLLIKEAELKRMPVTQYDLVKSLFVADRSHLNKFGRPITYDNYVAMKHGPVPSLAYDLLKENRRALTAYNLAALPWTRTPAEKFGKGCYTFSAAKTENEDQFLSPSGIEELQKALTTVATLSFGEMRKITHKDRAYKEAWDAVGDASSNLMSLGLLFDTPNFEAAEIVEFSSRQLADAENFDDDFAIPADFDCREGFEDR